jgi:hypothetical protein
MHAGRARRAQGQHQPGEHAHGRHGAISGNKHSTDVKENWMHLSQNTRARGVISSRKEVAEKKADPLGRE